MLPPSLIVALGLGFCFVPLTIVAVSGTTDADAGLASGLINTATQVGAAIGRCSRAFLVGAGFAMIGMVLALPRRSVIAPSIGRRLAGPPFGLDAQCSM